MKYFSDDMFRLIHSVTLGTAPLENHKSAIFLPREALKNLISDPRQTKCLDNSNVLHMFNSNIYTDFRTAY